MLSERVSLHRTGRPTSRAHQAVDDVLGVHARLRPETPADIRRDHVDPVRLEAERGGERVAHPVGGLGRGIEHEPAVALDQCGGRPRLERAGRDPLVDDSLADDDLAPVEERVVMAELQGEAVVRADFGVQQHLVLEGVDGIDGDRQRVIVDDDELGGVGAAAGFSATIAMTASPT